MSLSLDEARQLLGKDGDQLSDTEIEQILEALYVFAGELLELEEGGEL